MTTPNNNPATPSSSVEQLRLLAAAVQASTRSLHPELKPDTLELVDAILQADESIDPGAIVKSRGNFTSHGDVLDQQAEEVRLLLGYVEFGGKRPQLNLVPIDADFLDGPEVLP